MARKSTKSESVEPATASSPATTKKSSSNTPAKPRSRATSKAGTPSAESKEAKALASASASAAAVTTPKSGTTPKSASRRQSTRPKKAAVAPSSKTGAVTQLLLGQAIALSLSFVGHLIIAQLTGNELSNLKTPGAFGGGKTLQEFGVQCAWRVFAFAFAWFGDLDFVDVSALTFLTYAPAGYLMSTFYLIRIATVVSVIVVEMAAAALPVYLLRPVSQVHKPGSKVHNRDLWGGLTRVYVTVFAIAVYTVTVVLAFRFVMPSVLVVSFAGVKTVQPAYQANHLSSLPVMVAFGASAAAFLFPSFVSTGKSKDDEKLKQFDPVDASLTQTFWWNFWGYTVKTKVLLRRTAITVVSTGMGTYLTCTIPIDGVDPTGAAAYAGVWVVAAVMTALGIGYIGQD